VPYFDEPVGRVKMQKTKNVRNQLGTCKATQFAQKYLCFFLPRTLCKFIFTLLLTRRICIPYVYYLDNGGMKTPEHRIVNLTFYGQFQYDSLNK